MSLLVDPPFSLGQTLGVTSATQGGNWVGAVKQFPDVNPITGVVRSNRVKTCVAVRNTSGAALLPKRVVTFDTGTAGLASFTETKGYSAVTNEERVGVVDEFLPATGVAANDVYWVTVEGPTDATSGATTSGRVTKSAVAAGTQLANDNSLGVLGRACSAGATTGANVLAIVKTRY
jgi:hypothetical protein